LTAFLPQRLDPRQPFGDAAPPLALGIREHDVRVLRQDFNPHEPPTESAQRLNMPRRS
jgi:hypothetical protein